MHGEVRQGRVTLQVGVSCAGIRKAEMQHIRRYNYETYCHYDCL